MNISGYGQRFLAQEKFLNFCKDLGIKLLSSNIEEKFLEFLEKEKILFPEYKLVLPVGYAKFLRDSDYQTRQNSIIKSQWKTIDQTREKIDDWHFTDDIFHPFDKHKITIKSVKAPEFSHFTAWNKKPKTGTDETKIPIQINYYPYWKAYYVYEIIEACTARFIVNSFSMAKVFKIWKEGLSSDLVKQYTLPFYSSSLKDDIIQNSGYFSMLSFYIQSVERTDMHSIDKCRNYLNLSPEAQDRYDKIIETQKIKIAHITKNKFNFSKSDMLRFTNLLCRKYFEYSARHMDKLSDMLNDDIRHITRLLISAYELSRREVIEEVGRVRGSHLKKPLEYILSDKLSEAKESAFFSFKDFTKSKYITLKEDEFDKFIEFCDDNYMESIYIDIHRLNFTSRNYYSITQNLFSLSLSLEGFLRTMLSVSNQAIPCNFKEILKSFFKDEKWWSILCKNWQTFTKIDNEFDLNFRIEQILEQNFSKKNKWDELIKTFLIVGVLRNNFAHSPFTVSFEKFHPTFYVEKIVEAIWFSWDYVFKKNFV